MFITTNSRRQKGFTLLEILIALFIFSILSVILVGALRSVMDAQAGTERKAERLRSVQMVLLMMSRDIEQTVDRPVLDAAGKEEASFIGTSTRIILTHTGVANPLNLGARSSLQRTSFYVDNHSLWRTTWDALDRTPESKEHKRELLNSITAAQFQFLDKDGNFQDNWPMESASKQPLPRAIRIILTVAQWGKISQLYLLAPQVSHVDPEPPKS